MNTKSQIVRSLRDELISAAVHVADLAIAIYFTLAWFIVSDGSGFSFHVTQAGIMALAFLCCLRGIAFAGSVAHLFVGSRRPSIRTVARTAWLAYYLTALILIIGKLKGLWA